MKLTKDISVIPLAAAALMWLPGSAQAQDFEGFYGVAEGGIAILETDGSTIAGPFSTSDNSGVFGGALGYRMPVGGNSRFVLGGEGALGIYTDGTNARYGFYGIGGYRVGDAGLLYARLGYSWLEDIRTGVGRGIDGLTFGGGFEFPLRGRMNLRLDYRYIDFDEINIPDNQVNFDGHEITAGFVLNF